MNAQPASDARSASGPASEARARRAARNSLLGTLLVVAWAVVTLVGLAALSFNHMFAMPTPGQAQSLSQAMLSLRQGSGREFLVHVIDGDCSCTERLFAHLLERGPFPDVEEVVLFAGNDPGKQRAAEGAGFAFVAISSTALLERYHLEVAPVLVAFDGAANLRYLGGYYDHPAAMWPRDERLRDELARGDSPRPLPVFGCAVSERLQNELDPLGIAART